MAVGVGWVNLGLEGLEFFNKKVKSRFDEKKTRFSANLTTSEEKNVKKKWTTMKIEKAANSQGFRPI